jgi:DNA-binding MarR family transcriptional regulator
MAAAGRRRACLPFAMSDITDEDIAEAIVSISAAHRRLWPPQRRYPQGGQPPLNATDQQVLLVWASAPNITRDEIAEQLAVDVSSVNHSVRKLTGRGLLKERGRGLDRRTREHTVTPGGYQAVVTMIDNARPIVEALATGRRESGQLWP